jgi:hypothetical protein
MNHNRGTHCHSATTPFARYYSALFHLRSALMRMIDLDVHESFAHRGALCVIQVQFHAVFRLTPSQR